MYYHNLDVNSLIYALPTHRILYFVIIQCGVLNVDIVKY